MQDRGSSPCVQKPHASLKAKNNEDKTIPLLCFYLDMESCSFPLTMVCDTSPFLPMVKRKTFSKIRKSRLEQFLKYFAAQSILEDAVVPTGPRKAADHLQHLQ